MENLIIQIKRAKVRKLIDSLADWGLITLLPNRPTWSERWKTLSASLPQSSEISEEEILNEIAEVRKKRLNAEKNKTDVVFQYNNS
ncbi:hypothetical protein [Dyadobacter sp. 3J3]|uniref:hypothetical protein n=1 Tax=Dyadobacter sp. 3J3 TaxID=2606600 RepID=UPI00135A9DE7|nr:hypothetical protein [Dyadobacter sp. 3J3]